MRTLLILLAVSLLAAPCLFAEESEYHRIQFSDGSQPTNTMGYWDDGGYARSMLSMPSTSAGPYAAPTASNASVFSQQPSAGSFDENASQNSDAPVAPKAVAGQSSDNLQQSSFQP